MQIARITTTNTQDAGVANSKQLPILDFDVLKTHQIQQVRIRTKDASRWKFICKKNCSRKTDEWIK